MNYIYKLIQPKKVSHFYPIKINFKNLVLFCIVLLSVLDVVSQTTIQGVVKFKQPLESVSVILVDNNSKIISYSVSNKNGMYYIKTDKKGSFTLEISCIGYKKIQKSIIAKGQKITLDIFLEEDAISIEEVIINTKPPISVAKDKVTFLASKFKDGTEINVEELLKKIPDINVSENGDIYVGNVEIEKIMVEGDDLFKKGYKLLSKNMPVHPIEKIEVLKKYSDNKILKNIENSNKVALNLKLNEKYKRFWFGNIKASSNFTNRYDLLLNLMNFGKKTKYYFITKTNNLGINSSNMGGDIGTVINSFKTTNNRVVGKKKHQRKDLIEINPRVPYIKSTRTIFNVQKLFSATAIFKPYKKIKMTPSVILNVDENEFIKKTINTVNTQSTQFTNVFNHQLQKRQKIGFINIDIEYDMSKNNLLESTTKYNKGLFKDIADLTFNNINNIKQTLDNNNFYLDQNIRYTTKINTNSALFFSTRFNNEQTNQNYNINRFLYSSVFPSFSGNAVQQEVKKTSQFTGLNAYWIKKTKKNFLEIELGHTSKKENLISSFNILKDNTKLKTQEEYQNNGKYSTSNLYLKGLYTLRSMKKVRISTTLETHKIYNRLLENNKVFKQSPFFINGSVNLNLNLNSKNRINAFFSHNNTNASFLDIYNGFILNKVLSFSRGTGQFNQLAKSSMDISYNYGGFLNDFHFEIKLSKTQLHDLFSNRNLIRSNINISERILTKDNAMSAVNLDLNYFLSPIGSNLKFDYQYHAFTFKNIINNISREMKIIKNIYDVSLKSSFIGVFNYRANYKHTVNTIKNSFNFNSVDKEAYVDFYFKFKKNISNIINYSYYNFGDLNTNNEYHFLDFKINYKIKKDKLELSLIGKNILNIKKVKRIRVNDFSSSLEEYNILPRFILLKLEYKF